MHTRNKGKIGEDVSVEFLKKRGFVIVERNYQKKWGEIDIIARKSGVIHFFEVKSVQVNSSHRPEDNVHGLKVRHIRRMVETYVKENGETDSAFSFHVLCVFIDYTTRKARIKWIKDIIL